MTACQVRRDLLMARSFDKKSQFLRRVCPLPNQLLVLLYRFRPLLARYGSSELPLTGLGLQKSLYLNTYLT